VAAQDAIDHPMPSVAAASSSSAANAGKKRTRAAAEEPAAAAAPAKPAAAPAAAAKPAGKAAASGKPAAVAGAAAAGSSSSSSSGAAAQQALPDSAQDKVFELTDEELEPSTVALWQRFHAGCWATSCPVHASPSAPAAFFAQGAALLKALYGGLEFPADLMHLLQFAVKAHHAAAEKECCKVEFQPDAKADDAAATDAAAATSSDGAAAAAAAPSVPEAVSGNDICSWHACCAAIRSVFVSTAGVELAGPLRVLLGEFRHQSPQSVHPFLLDRGFYDSAEVWTFLAVVSGEGAANFRHYAYYRDDPRPAYPAAFVGVLNASEPTVTPVGPNALAALLHAVDKAQQQAGGGTATTTAKRQKVASGAAAAALAASTGPWTLDQLRSELESYGKTHGLLKGGAGSGKKAAPAPKRDPAWLKRDKKVVCDLDNGVGLVVPYGSFAPSSLLAHERPGQSPSADACASMYCAFSLRHLFGFAVAACVCVRPSVCLCVPARGRYWLASCQL
jgi:hypothetical protein